MGTIQLSTQVEAPPEHVFEVFSDVDRAPERIEGITRVERVGDGPVGRGTRWKETRVMFKREATEELWFAEFDPPRRYVVQADSCGADFFTTFTFTPERGGTRVDVEMRTRARTLGAKLMAPLGFLFAGTMKKCLRRDLEDLKRVAEAG